MKRKSPTSTRASVSSLTLQIGSQYLCHTGFNAPNMPDVLRTLKTPPHLHLVVDTSIRLLSSDEQAYEVRLSLQGFGLEHMPTGQEDQPSLYHATVIYGGLFALQGKATEAKREKFLSSEGPGFLYPSARMLLLAMIREAGFSVGTLQPIDFHTFWQKRQEQKIP